jgi:hypothetical protein
MNATFSRHARRDVDHHADYLDESAGFAVAQRFLNSVRDTAAVLARMPGIGSPFPIENVISSFGISAFVSSPNSCSFTGSFRKEESKCCAFSMHRKICRRSSKTVDLLAGDSWIGGLRQNVGNNKRACPPSRFLLVTISKPSTIDKPYAYASNSA